MRERLGEGVVVRSDDIDENDIIGTATTPLGVVHRFRAHATDDGQMVGSDIEPEP
ncbi:MAG: hypothetical protein ACRDZ8_01960 [Acidimicrobiales bacterium]